MLIPFVFESQSLALIQRKNNKTKNCDPWELFRNIFRREDECCHGEIKRFNPWK